MASSGVGQFSDSEAREADRWKNPHRAFSVLPGGRAEKNRGPRAIGRRKNRLCEFAKFIAQQVSESFTP